MLNITTLGPDGSYCSQVARAVSRTTPNIKFTGSNKETIHGLKGHNFGILPVYNRYGGVVAENMEAVFEVSRNSTVKILGWYDLPIRHVLAALPGQTEEDIQAVFSHRHALKQCSSNLRSLNASQTATSSTTSHISELQPGQAVICSLESAQKRRLEIISGQFCREENVTEFAILTSLRNQGTDELHNFYGDKTIAIIKATRQLGFKAFGVLGDFDLKLGFTETVPNGKGGVTFPTVLSGIGTRKDLIKKKVADLGASIEIL